MSYKRNTWFRLDNAGKLYPSIMSSRVSTLFRLSATLTEIVNPQILQKALDNLMPRFPYFQVNLRCGIFWYYFVHTDKLPQIEKETFYPCMSMEVKKKGKFPFRVLYYNKRISVEFSHAITDGTGASIFLKSLIVEYFRLKGIKIKQSEGFFNYAEKPDNEEYEDAFKKYYNKKIPKLPRKDKAFQFPFPLESKGIYHIVTGIIPVKNILKKAKEFNVTLTEFLLAIYFQSILEVIYSLPSNKRNKLLKPIVLNVPVNLRGIYPSKTMRNFFISITPKIDPRLGVYSFEEIIKYVHHFMKVEVDKKYINQQITMNVKSELSIILRLFPLVLKNMIMPIIYNVFAESRYTSGFSNIGKITMPQEIEDYIERFELYPPPSQGNIIKVAAVSYRDKLYISFGKLTKNKIVEKIFFRKIRKMNIPVKIETN
ncbi:hypothetical protein [Paramaledivibacter caminithermalis]|jgi:hypothetical protein|uniref:Alcohol acetyltransferase n=1 Tax=Paramaledivibacter caminithermalis (strain DSM 15212 / CIP 107654 / DViRD3) TaxID=1121301 RepID=A0A1M6P3X5_PARC5|nr:hypothetical protein [Paramaledivibacter caminithermalis]SHK02624.1 hypothetical protein SAMN02745912_02004 [Paramaledivibacter caminithermalis DSM 15212]